MRVDQSKSSPIQSSDVKKADGAKKAQGPKGSEKTGDAHGTSSGAVKAEVSDRAREMAQARQIATDAPETREERIAALKARIQSGDYKVDSKAVADRMVDDHLRSGIG